MIQRVFRLSWGMAFAVHVSVAWAQCEADHNVIVTNFEFTPSSLTVVPGETVAFINIEGLHGVNGDSSTVTGASFGNPEVFALDQAEGAIEGTCLGVVTFDIPGVYRYDCPVGYNAEAGMQAEIVVDAFDLADLLFQTSQAGEEPTFWQSGYAFEAFVPEVLTSLTPHTLFAPSDQAVSNVMDFMNLGQFDMLNIPDFTEIMQYHVVPGVLMAEDLTDGMALQTLQGQTLPVVVNDQGTFVDGAQVIAGDYVADNGVVHVLDSVLAPQGLPTQHVMGWIEESEEHGILWLAIQQLGLQDDLSFQVLIDNSYSEPGPWTVWAPTDLAFEILMEQQGWSVADLMNSQVLYELVQNHVVQSSIAPSQLTNGFTFTNLNGDVGQVLGEPGAWTIEDANILGTGHETYNGHVYVLDAVLAPEIDTPEGTCGVWRLELLSGGAGWGEHYVELQLGEAVEDFIYLPNGSSMNYYFGVDVGQPVNVVYYAYGDGGQSESFRVYDGDNNLVHQSGVNPWPAPAFGLQACQPEPTNVCGELTVEMTDDWGDGWDIGALKVYINDAFAYELTLPNGQGPFEVSLPVQEGDEFDFIYVSSYFPQENGYVVRGLDGEVLVDESSFEQTPGNLVNVFPCPATSLVDDREPAKGVTLRPNPSDAPAFTLQGQGLGALKVTLSSLQGEVLWSGIQQDSGSPVRPGELASGVYLIQWEELHGTSSGTARWVLR